MSEGHLADHQGADQRAGAALVRLEQALAQAAAALEQREAALAERESALAEREAQLREKEAALLARLESPPAPRHTSAAPAGQTPQLPLPEPAPRDPALRANVASALARLDALLATQETPGDESHE